ncbi:MAG TPA: DUF6094 domain-containing protein, partial [Thermoanaerobaculia bacterium]|nr:DUF6094 domain-containing protein [Thermoanaerobaculia bacterium]
MARPASLQTAGYFPSPIHLLDSFASTLRWPETGDDFREAVLFDPCAGDGQAIETLRSLWCGDPGDDRRPGASIVACELEESRARSLAFRLRHGSDRALCGDAFRLVSRHGPGDGATVLYLNPPYDQDRAFGRLEARFLERFTRHLHAGSGMLLYLVPVAALAASAEILGREYLDLRAWRLPEPDYRDFSQVLVVGRRAPRPLARAPFAAAVRRWGLDPLSIPVLPARVEDPLAIDLEGATYDLYFALEPHDLTAALDGFRPWLGAPVGVGLPVGDLLGARFETAMPPKPAHIALAISSGLFNGRRIEPNDPSRHPPLLAKGQFEREPLDVSERCDGEGRVVSRVQIERPRLRLNVLRLDSYTFHELAEGSIPTGSDEVSDWNPADLIAHYDRSLARLLARQFPPLHDPARPAHRLALPALARKPFRVQAEAVQAALKLLA